MVRELRKARGAPRHGLVLANGGVMSYQHVVCLSSHSRKGGSAYPVENPLPALVTDVPIPAVDEQAEGEATVEVRFCFSSSSDNYQECSSGIVAILTLPMAC